jgi:hypothetical protein
VRNRSKGSLSRTRNLSAELVRGVGKMRGPFTTSRNCITLADVRPITEGLVPTEIGTSRRSEASKSSPNTLLTLCMLFYTPYLFYYIPDLYQPPSVGIPPERCFNFPKFKISPLYVSQASSRLSRLTSPPQTRNSNLWYLSAASLHQISLPNMSKVSATNVILPCSYIFRVLCSVQCHFCTNVTNNT